MQKESFITNSSIETRRLGKILAAELKGGEILCLIGDLGGGKTTFAQGVAEGLFVKEQITSPTFVIFKKFAVHRKKIKWLYHFDLYRISHTQELLDLGFQEIIKSQENIIIIEWAQKAKEIIPQKNKILIKFKYLGKEKRKVSFSPSG